MMRHNLYCDQRKSQFCSHQWRAKNVREFLEHQLSKKKETLSVSQCISVSENANQRAAHVDIAHEFCARMNMQRRDLLVYIWNGRGGGGAYICIKRAACSRRCLTRATHYNTQESRWAPAGPVRWRGAARAAHAPDALLRRHTRPSHVFSRRGARARHL